MPFSIIIQYDVPFNRKEEAKKKYLKWNPTDKKWYNSYEFRNNVINENFSKKLEKDFHFYCNVIIEFEIHEIKIDNYNCPTEYLEEIKNVTMKIRKIKIEQERENKKRREDPDYICDY